MICVISLEIIFILPEPRLVRNRLKSLPNRVRKRERVRGMRRGEKEKEKRESETGRRWD